MWVSIAIPIMLPPSSLNPEKESSTLTQSQKLMKLFSRNSTNGFKPISQTILGGFTYSTKTPFSSSSSNDTLYKRISPAGDPRVSIVPILDQWLKEGKPIQRVELQSLLKQLRDFRRFHHALEVSHWMSDRMYFVLSPGDAAVRLDLISKVHGLQNAEEYFDKIPKQLKQFQVYGALLNCYAHWRSVEKAESIMQKMKELKFVHTCLPYALMLNLYAKVGQHEKLDILMEEMDKYGICHNTYTLNIRLNSYADTANIEGMEKTLQRMEGNPEIFVDWGSYHTASKGYITAGMMDKALEMLKKSEGLITGTKGRRVGYEYLISTYAVLGRKDEVYRIWNLYKLSEKLYNKAYTCMLFSLVKLEDIAGAEKIFQEWESGGTSYDFRVANIMIYSYCKDGQLERAKTLVNNAIEKGKKPYGSTWEHLAVGYIEADQMPEAINAMKKAIPERWHRWKPNRDTLVTCLKYLKDKGDYEGIVEFARLSGIPGPFSTNICERLLNHMYDEGQPESGGASEMDGDALHNNEDTDRIQEMRFKNVN